MPMVISARFGQGQHNPPVNAEFAAAGDARGIGDLLRYCPEELPHEEDVKSAAAENGGTTSGRKVSTQPRRENTMKLGTSSTAYGRKSVAITMPNQKSRPGKAHGRESIGAEGRREYNGHYI